MLLALAGVGFAEELSLTVTGTIPAVPGLNAPPLTEGSAQNQQITAARDVKIEETLAAAQCNQAFIVAQTTTATQITQTIYCR